MNVIILEMNYLTVVSSKAECKILVLVLCQCTMILII